MEETRVSLTPESGPGVAVGPDRPGNLDVRECLGHSSVCREQISGPRGTTELARKTCPELAAAFWRLGRLFSP